MDGLLEIKNMDKLDHVVTDNINRNKDQLNKTIDNEPTCAPDMT